jgi:MFS family permease
MMAVMAEADDWNTGRASGLLVLWFGIGFAAMPPVFGWLVEGSDGYRAGFALLAAVYAFAVVVIAAGRSSFRSTVAADPRVEAAAID